MRHSIPIGRGLLLFWSVWLSVVFASNLADGLRHAGLLPDSWRFTSGNFALIGEAVGIYVSPTFWAPVLFGGVVVVQLAAALLFWRACLDRQALAAPGRPKLLQAFGVACGLFAGFLVADELFIVYDRLPAIETTHFLVLCALLLSLLVITLLGTGERAA